MSEFVYKKTSDGKYGNQCLKELILEARAFRIRN